MIKKDIISEKHLMFSFPDDSRFSFLLAGEVRKELEAIRILRDMRITVNMETIHFVDSQGFDFLVEMARNAEQCMYKFEMIHILPEVHELIRLLELENILGEGPEILKSCS